MKSVCRVFILLLGLLLPSWAEAHIGSPTVVYEGAAGPYMLRVIIRPPEVIPGRANIDIRFLNTAPAGLRVTVLPVSAGLGLTGSPPPDEALPVRGDEALRHAELWLMTTGSYSVHVVVSGGPGEGKMIVPVAAIAVRQPKMSTGLGVILSLLGALLFSSAVALVIAGARECVLPPDIAPDPGKRRVFVAAGVAIAVFGFGIVQGKKWWDEEDRRYRLNQMYHPAPIYAEARVEGGQRLIRLTLPGDPKEPEAEPPPILPDHGKLMHLFLIREPQLDAFAHVHPIRISPRQFDLAAPPLPGGTYRLYADITFENGFASTLTTTLNLSEGTDGSAPRSTWLAPDSDDSWFPQPSASAKAPLYNLKAKGPAKLRAGEAVALQFEVDDEDGKAVELEPYMGMLGHAAVRKSDGSVFAHLHPVGTISMAAQQYFETQAQDPQTPVVTVDHSHMHHSAHSVTSVGFPYEFPSGGIYRLWVQVKTGSRVVTDVFDLNVADAK